MICLLLCAFLCACSLNGDLKKNGIFRINDTGNNTLGEITVTSRDITVSDGTGSLTGVKKRDDKRKYYSSSEVMEYAVKYSDDGFKLRDRNENMIWSGESDIRCR